MGKSAEMPLKPSHCAHHRPQPPSLGLTAPTGSCTGCVTRVARYVAWPGAPSNAARMRTTDAAHMRMQGGRRVRARLLTKPSKTPEPKGLAQRSAGGPRAPVQAVVGVAIAALVVAADHDGVAQVVDGCAVAERLRVGLHRGERVPGARAQPPAGCCSKRPRTPS